MSLVAFLDVLGLPVQESTDVVAILEEKEARCAAQIQRGSLAMIRHRAAMERLHAEIRRDERWLAASAHRDPFVQECRSAMEDGAQRRIARNRRRIQKHESRYHELLVRVTGCKRKLYAIRTRLKELS